MVYFYQSERGLTFHLEQDMVYQGQHKSLFQMTCLHQLILWIHLYFQIKFNCFLLQLMEICSQAWAVSIMVIDLGCFVIGYRFNIHLIHFHNDNFLLKLEKEHFDFVSWRNLKHLLTLIPLGSFLDFRSFWCNFLETASQTLFYLR